MKHKLNQLSNFFKSIMHYKLNRTIKVGKYQLSSDGIKDDDGKIISYKFKKFYQDIVLGNNCFICGAAKGTVVFDDEHIFPKWILRKYGIFNVKLQLPNSSGMPYSQHIIPCCEKCNKLMSATFENDIKLAVDKGYDAFKTLVAERGEFFIFQWMALIFLKNYLKDMHLNFHRDKRLKQFKIGELHDYRLLLHIHAIARSFYTGALIGPGVLGSLYITKATRVERASNFNYGDFFSAGSVYIQLGEVAIVCVFDDGGFVKKALQPLLDKIDAPISGNQLDEIFVRFSLKASQLNNHPRFSSAITDEQKYAIVAKLPPIFSFSDVITTELQNLIKFRLNKDVVNESSYHEAVIFDGLQTDILDENHKFKTTSQIVFDPDDKEWTISCMKAAGLSENEAEELFIQLKTDGFGKN